MGDPLKFSWDMGPTYRYNMEIIYLQSTEEIQFTLNTISTGWLALGFGTSMFDVDMITWHANGAESYAKDYYAIKHAEPEADAD